MAAVFFIDSFNLISLGADWKTWYAPAGLATFFLLLGIAIFAFWRFARFARVVQRRRESLKEEVRRQNDIQPDSRVRRVVRSKKKNRIGVALRTG